MPTGWQNELVAVSHQGDVWNVGGQPTGNGWKPQGELRGFNLVSLALRNQGDQRHEHGVNIALRGINQGQSSISLLPANLAE